MSEPRNTESDSLDPLVINFQSYSAICAICGKATDDPYGVPVSIVTAQIVANDSLESWVDRPACMDCYSKHLDGALVGEFPSY